MNKRPMGFWRYLAPFAWLISSAYSPALAATASPQDQSQLAIGILYELAANAGEFKPTAEERCNARGEPGPCVAPRGSIFEVVRIDSTDKTVVIRFVRVPDEARFVLPAKIRVESQSTYITSLQSLADASKRYEAAFTGSLKAVVIPAKLYTSNWQQGANPTLGVAFSFTPKREALNPLEFLASVEFGMGFNQIAVDTSNKSEERTGLSIFAGYNFRNVNDSIGLGIYLGRDFVRLKPGEEFAGAGRRHRTWLGLVLSTDVATK